MNTEQLICEKLIDMMEERPFQQIKVTQLAERCGISRSTFYVYFDSIYSVLQKIEDDIIYSFVDEHEVNSRNQPAEVMDSFVFMRDNIRTIQILSGPNGDPSFFAKLSNRNRRVLHMLAEKNSSHASDLELQIISEFALGGKMRLIQWWANNEKSVSIKEMAELSEKIMAAIHSVVW